MKKYLILFLIISAQCIYSWGDKGHQLIAEYSIKALPGNVKLLKDSIAYIIKHSIDPDYRKDRVKDEYHKHFIDIDFYQEFRDGKMTEDQNLLINKYGKDTVDQIGILPWATLETYNNLVNAFRLKDTAKILLSTSDLVHYVADGHQPQHTTLNYNGQLTGQKGVHFRYEVEMFDRYANAFESGIKLNNAKPIDDLSKYIFNYIQTSNKSLNKIMKADKIAFQMSNNNYKDKNYIQLLYKHSRAVTQERVNSAIGDLANIIYSAYLKGIKK